MRVDGRPVVSDEDGMLHRAGINVLADLMFFNRRERIRLQGSVCRSKALTNDSLVKVNHEDIEIVHSFSVVPERTVEI